MEVYAALLAANGGCASRENGTVCVLGNGAKMAFLTLALALAQTPLTPNPNLSLSPNRYPLSLTLTLTLTRCEDGLPSLLGCTGD